MSYRKALEKIPEELLRQLQNYVDGEYLYIPRRPEAKRPWGHSTHSREELQRRNAEIWADYQKGASLSQLAGAYFLTEKSIARILRELRRQENEKV